VAEKDDDEPHEDFIRRIEVLMGQEKITMPGIKIMISGMMISFGGSKS